MIESGYGNRYKMYIVCIDGYECEILNGRVYAGSPELDTGICFHGTINFLKKMEYIMGEGNLTQESASYRSFQSIRTMDIAEKVMGTSNKGRIGTFTLQVLFQQHTSWQGTVSWIEGKKKENFRSVLELLLLIDSALNEKAVEQVDTKVEITVGEGEVC